MQRSASPCRGSHDEASALCGEFFNRYQRPVFLVKIPSNKIVWRNVATEAIVSRDHEFLPPALRAAATPCGECHWERMVYKIERVLVDRTREFVILHGPSTDFHKWSTIIQDQVSGGMQRIVSMASTMASIASSMEASQSPKSATERATKADQARKSVVRTVKRVADEMFQASRSVTRLMRAAAHVNVMGQQTRGSVASTIRCENVDAIIRSNMHEGLMDVSSRCPVVLSGVPEWGLLCANLLAILCWNLAVSTQCQCVDMRHRDLANRICIRWSKMMLCFKAHVPPCAEEDSVFVCSIIHACTLMGGDARIDDGQLRAKVPMAEGSDRLSSMSVSFSRIHAVVNIRNLRLANYIGDILVSVGARVSVSSVSESEPRDRVAPARCAPQTPEPDDGVVNVSSMLEMVGSPKRTLDVPTIVVVDGQRDGTTALFVRGITTSNDPDNDPFKGELSRSSEWNDSHPSNRSSGSFAVPPEHPLGRFATKLSSATVISLPLKAHQLFDAVHVAARELHTVVDDSIYSCDDDSDPSCGSDSDSVPSRGSGRDSVPSCDGMGKTIWQASRKCAP